MESGYSEFRRAFFEHKAVSGTSNTHNMILFYTAECGLKALHTGPVYNKLPRSICRDSDVGGHDLQKLFEKLKPPRNSLPRCPICRANNNNNIPHRNIHEAWRYGVRLDTNSQNSIVSWLKNLINFIEPKL